MTIKKIPAGLEGVIPHLTCSPCVDAIAFYKKALGAIEVSRIFAPDGHRIMHAHLRVGGANVYLVDDFPEYCGGKPSTATALGGSPVTLHRYVENCDEAIRIAHEAGAQVVMPAADMFWGDRYGMVVDPFGHKWSFATHLKELTDAEMESAMASAFAQA